MTSLPDRQSPFLTNHSHLTYSLIFQENNTIYRWNIRVFVEKMWKNETIHHKKELITDIKHYVEKLIQESNQINIAMDYPLSIQYNRHCGKILPSIILPSVFRFVVETSIGKLTYLNSQKVQASLKSSLEILEDTHTRVYHD